MINVSCYDKPLLKSVISNNEGEFLTQVTISYGLGWGNFIPCGHLVTSSSEALEFSPVSSVSGWWMKEVVEDLTKDFRNTLFPPTSCWAELTHVAPPNPSGQEFSLCVRRKLKGDLGNM